jgi:hypothetical protein
MALVMAVLRFPRSCWFLLASFAVLAFGAMDASAYAIAAGVYHSGVINPSTFTR